ncbi:hypothetical protein WNJ68_19725 [Klebsiella grimontii]|uniref:hypothetical protein n=1 Tax=Klebsiella TaxID=570 RepID=UPI0015A705A4|nr:MULTISPECIES: hypothetical protein [Klebsiella]QQO25966.1 hypothetical protein IMZ21_20020 [Klebsiella michiganensis]WPI51606.1 hypothetical protein R8547_16020 [Klebsiella oxytoca]HDX8776507.1 hypothetical protein [Klebsiella oxytoca]
MSALTYAEDINNLSETLCTFKKEKRFESFLKSQNIHNAPLNRINLEVHSQTLEIEKCANRVFPSEPLHSTRVAEISTTQPQSFGRKKTHDNELYKKFKARAKEKITYLEKALDTYGVIDEVKLLKSHKEIHARIYDINSHEIIDEISFSSEEFSKSDQKRLVESAIFYWYVGLERTIFGQEKRVSEFRLRRVFNNTSL